MGALLLGLTIYAIGALWTGTEGLWRVLSGTDLQILMAALGLSLVNYVVRWSKWHIYLQRLEIDVPVVESVVVFVAGFVMSITPGKVGEVLKSALLKQSRGVSIARSAPVVLAERVTDLFGLVVIAAFGVAFFDFGRIALVVVAAGLVVGTVILQQPRWVARCLDIFERMPLGAKLRPRLDEAYASMRELLRLPVLSLTIALSTIGWGMEATAFYLIVVEYGGLGTLHLVAFLFATTTILGAVSFLPGGLGVTEGSMIGALLLFGVFVAEADAAAATYLIRATTLWFGVALGLVALGLFRWKFASLPDLDGSQELEASIEE